MKTTSGDRRQSTNNITPERPRPGVVTRRPSGTSMRRVPDFGWIFDRIEVPAALLDVDLRIIAVTDGYVRTIGLARDEVVGCVLLDLVADEEEPSSSCALRESLSGVLSKREKDRPPPLRYAVRDTRRASRDDVAAVVPAAPLVLVTNVPIIGADDSVVYILHELTHMTEVERLRRIAEDLSLSNARLDSERKSEAAGRATTERILVSEASRAAMLQNVVAASAELTDAAADPAVDDAALLRVAARSARSIASAGFAGVGLGTDPCKPLAAWSYDVAFHDAASPRIDPPRPVGVLGELARGSSVLRHGESAELAAVAPGHPVMTSFLGVPLRARGEHLGILYVGNRVGAATFSGEDAHAVALLAGQLAVLILNRRLYAQARAALCSRDDVLAMVSHDLRTFLNTIACRAALLDRSAPPDARRDVAAIVRAQRRMAALIEDLVSCATLESGTLKVSPAVARLPPVVIEAVDNIAPLANERGTRVEVGLPDDVPPVRFDCARLLQVLTNLLGNAIKFSPKGTSVRVTVEPTPSDVRVSVRDSGPGIPPDELPHVFERYWRSKTSAASGLGLGLFIAKSLIEAQNGRLSVESGVGRGATFTVALPVAREARADAAAPAR